MASPSLVDLAQQILTAATTVQRELDDQGLPQPSFDATGRQDYHDAGEQPGFLEARAQLIEASQSMLCLARGPVDGLRALVGTDRSSIMVLRAIDELDLAQAVPLETPVAVEALAATLHVHLGPLRRILGFAYTRRIFYEPVPGYVGHTALSAAIPFFSPYIRLALSPASIMGGLKWAESLQIRADDPAVPIPVHLALPQYTDYWHVVREAPDGMAKFSAAMRVVSQAMVGPKYTQYVRGFDWAALGAAVVVDLGGGNGHIGCALAQAFSDLRVIVQDLATNAAPCQATIAAVLRDRVTFQAQDFFQPQPAALVESPPRAYLLSRVLHDWPDGDCVRILSHLVPAAARGTKLFVVDRILPTECGRMPLQQEADIRSLDLLMYNLVGGRERTLGEWTTLFHRADARLTVERAVTPAGSDLAMLEVGIV